MALLESKQATGKMARFLSKTREFNCKFKYLPGESNVVAHFLSRNSSNIIKDKATKNSIILNYIKDAVNTSIAND